MSSHDCKTFVCALVLCVAFFILRLSHPIWLICLMSADPANSHGLQTQIGHRLRHCSHFPFGWRAAAITPMHTIAGLIFPSVFFSVRLLNAVIWHVFHHGSARVAIPFAQRVGFRFVAPVPHSQFVLHMHMQIRLGHFHASWSALKAAQCQLWKIAVISHFCKSRTTFLFATSVEIANTSKICKYVARGTCIRFCCFSSPDARSRFLAPKSIQCNFL